jgi:hypothetical protein
MVAMEGVLGEACGAFRPKKCNVTGGLDCESSFDAPRIMGSFIDDGNQPLMGNGLLSRVVKVLSLPSQSRSSGEKTKDYPLSK